MSPLALIYTYFKGQLEIFFGQNFPKSVQKRETLRNFGLADKISIMGNFGLANEISLMKFDSKSSNL